MRALGLVATVVVLASCASEDDRSTATIARVVDGDTVVLTNGDRVRLVQIDAPELAEGECYGERATRALQTLLPRGAAVELERDEQLDDVDRFGRLLRYVHRDGVNVNVELVGRGAAGAYFFRGARGRYADELLEEARAARSDRRGLWDACPGTVLAPERAIETGSG